MFGGFSCDFKSISICYFGMIAPQLHLLNAIVIPILHGKLNTHMSLAKEVSVPKVTEN